MAEEKYKPMAIATWLPDVKRWSFMPAVVLIRDMQEGDENTVLLFTAEQIEQARQEEREACAKVCDAQHPLNYVGPAGITSRLCAAQIRKRSNA